MAEKTIAHRRDGTEKLRVTINVRAQLWDKLHDYCESRGLSLSSVVESAVLAKLAQD